MENSMEETSESQTETPEEENHEEGQDANGNSRQGKTWYPYITKVQFEKFLSRLESKVPEQIDRDYVRAIIRTPSMIYRFLRGIEAMKLIDRDQSPTPLLERVVNTETRAFALAEVQRDLYKDLLEEQAKSGEMNDEEIVEYFRERTGMGRDSANKMKMFFKYLNGEADFSQPPAAAPTSEPTTEETAESVETKADETPAKQEKAKEEAQPAQRTQSRERGGQQERSREGRENRQERSNPPRQERSNSPRQERSESTAPTTPPSPSYQDRPPRPLTEQQKAYLDTVRSVVSINIDGDWDEDMIRVAFDRLERLLDRIRRI
jgi:chemotaxis protein histidine kinase CheA